MKKSFTLKAFAFGAAATVALAASATPHEFLRADNTPKVVKSDIKAEAPLPTKMSVFKAEAAAKAPAQKAEPSYGGWDEQGEGRYKYVQVLETTANSQYERRNDTANPGEFQTVVKNWGKGIFTTQGTDLTFTVVNQTLEYSDGTVDFLAPTLPAEGVPTGIQAGGYPDGQKHDLYLFDHVSYMKALKAAGETWNDGSEITDEDCEQWYALYYFDEETGLMTYHPIYCLMVNNKPTWYTFPSSEKDATGKYTYYTESFQMLGGNYKNYDLELSLDNGYFSHEKDATTGTFNFKYNLNDNNEAWFQILTGKKTGTALQNAMQELLNNAYNGTTGDDVIKVTASTGEVAVPVTTYRSGSYTLLCAARYEGIEDGYFLTKSDNTLRLSKEDLDYYAAGTATYTDIIMEESLPTVFGADDYDALKTLFSSRLGITLPDVYTVTVPMQASSTVEGQYRLVMPYAEYYNNYLSSQLEYDAASDMLVFNVADPNKCFIHPCATGIYFPTESSGDIMMVYGSTNQMEGCPESSADIWGSISNGAVVFPEFTGTSMVDVEAPLSWSQASFNAASGVTTFADWVQVVFSPEVCKIEAATFAGIENVAADAEFDANAPVEYFNLQGIRVATPEAGQLLIQRQGNKATKVVIR